MLKQYLPTLVCEQACCTICLLHITAIRCQSLLSTLHDAWLLIACKPYDTGRAGDHTGAAACMLLAWCPEHQTRVIHLKGNADTMSSLRPAAFCWLKRSC